MQSVPPGKRMSKLTERAKAALDEQRETLTKRKASDQTTVDVVPKRVCSDPQTGTTDNSSTSSLRAPTMNKARQPTVEDVDDEDDEFQRERRPSPATRTTSKSHKATVEDDDEETTQSPERESDDDELSVSIL